MGLAIQPTRRIGGKIATLIAVFALVMQPMYGLVAERIVNAAANTVEVSPSDMQGWATDSKAPEFVADPNKQGSLKFTIDTGTTKQTLLKATDSQVLLKDLNGLAYNMRVDQSVPASYQLRVWGANGIGDNTNGFTTLVWEPNYNGHGNGPNGGFTDYPSLENGTWWSSQPIEGAQDRSTFVPLETVIEKNPNAFVYAFGLEASNLNAISFVDTLSFNGTTYDFKADPLPVVRERGGIEYATIQAAIDDPDTTAGDVIKISAGSFTGTTTITKSVTIKGAQAGVDPRPSVNSTRSASDASESTVVAQKGQRVFNIAADGVTIDGFTVKQAGGSGTNDAIKASSSQSNLTIVNNIVVDASDEVIQLEAGTNYKVDKNYILNPTGDGITYSTYSPLKGANLSITNNDITGSTSNYGSIYLYGVQNVMVSGNIINTKSSGIVAGVNPERVSNITIQDNTINTELYTAYSALAAAIVVDGDSDTVTIERNKLQQVGAVADSREIAFPERFNLIRVGVASASNPSNVIIRHNDLSRITPENYLYVNGGATEAVDAQLNWWGTPAGPTGKVTSPNATVTSSPWLCGPWETTPASTTDGSCDNSAPTDVTATSEADGKRVQTPNHNITFSAKDDAGLKRFDVTIWKKNDNRSDASTILGSWGSSIAASEKTDATRTVNITNILRNNHKVLPEGEYIIYFTATDLANKSTNGNSVTFTIDTTKPAAPKNLEVRVTAGGAYIPNNGYTNQKDVTASWKNGSNEDVTYIYKYWKTEGSAWTESNKWPHPTSATSYAGSYNQDEGVHRFCVVAVDQAGNESDCSATYTVTYDTTAPTAEIVTPADGSTVRGAIDITGKMIDDTQVGNHWFEIKGANYEKTTGPGVDNGTDTYAMSWNTKEAPNGTYTIRYVAKDKAGNRASATHTVVVDNPAPTVSIDPVTSSFDTRRPTITGTVGTNGELVEISTDRGATWVAPTTYDTTAGIWSYTYTTNLADASHTIFARATDPQNQTIYSETATRTFVVKIPSSTGTNTGSDTVVQTQTDPQVETLSSPRPQNLFAQNLQFMPRGNAIVGTNTAIDEDGDVASAIDMRSEDGDVLSAQDNKDQWSLINLLLSIVVGALSVIALFGIAGKKKDERNTLTRVLTLVPALGAGAVLLFAEDFSSPMGWVNIWTLLIGALVVAQMILLANTRSQDEQ